MHLVAGVVHHGEYVGGVEVHWLALVVVSWVEANQPIFYTVPLRSSRDSPSIALLAL